jgi:hypothetical protein
VDPFEQARRNPHAASAAPQDRVPWDGFHSDAMDHMVMFLDRPSRSAFSQTSQRARESVRQTADAFLEREIPLQLDPNYMPSQHEILAWVRGPQSLHEFIQGRVEPDGSIDTDKRRELIEHILIAFRDHDGIPLSLIDYIYDNELHVATEDIYSLFDPDVYPVAFDLPTLRHMGERGMWDYWPPNNGINLFETHAHDPDIIELLIVDQLIDLSDALVYVLVRANANDILTRLRTLYGIIFYSIEDPMYMFKNRPK